MRRSSDDPGPRRPRGAGSLVWYLPAALWATLVLYLGGRADLGAPVPGPPLDKLGHFVLYGVLGALAAWGRRRAGRPRHWAWLLAACCALGLADELRQRAVAGRRAEAADWAADALGAALGLALVARRASSTGQGRS